MRLWKSIVLFSPYYALKFFKIKTFKSFNYLRSHVAIDVILIQYTTPAACTHITVYSAKIFRRPQLLLSQPSVLYCKRPRVMSSRKERGGGNAKSQNTALMSTYWVNTLPVSSAGKECACKAGDPSSISGSGRFAGEGIGYPLQYSWASLVAQPVKNLPAIWETWVQALGSEDLLKKGTATYSSILAWRIPWTIPWGRRVRHN